jgi:Dual specificity phosphatase, catalytic domain
MKIVWRCLLLLCVAGSLCAFFSLRWIEQSYDQPFTQIQDGLFIGSAVNQPPPGTRAVVNLCGRKDQYETDAYLWEPIFESGNEPNIDWLRRVVEFIAAQRDAGRTTYVHCLAGMNRSGAVVTAYLMYEHGWGRDDALLFLQSKRDVVQPNPTLMRLLAEWEMVLKEKRISK